MLPPTSVLELIERYNHKRTAYRSEQYNEAQLRMEFLNHFFEALGRDVSFTTVWPNNASHFIS